MELIKSGNTEKDIQDTLKIVESSIVNCEKVRPKLKEGSSSFSLNTNRLRALYIAKELLTGQEKEYTKEELESTVKQITSIKNKSTTGIGNAKEGSGVHTRFSRLIRAMDIIIGYLENAMEHHCNSSDS